MEARRWWEFPDPLHTKRPELLNFLETPQLAEPETLAPVRP